MRSELHRTPPFPGGRKTAAIVLTYQRLPCFNSLIKAMNSVDIVTLVDNGSQPEILSQLRKFTQAHSGKCILIENNCNLGIPRAYNLAVPRLMDLGFYWYFFLDHDATFDESLFTEAGRAWNDAANSGVPVGVVVPLVSDDPSTVQSKLRLKSQYSSIRSTITSGILLNYDVFTAVHGFDEGVFLDGADFDLTIRIRRSGLSIVRVNRVLIIQDFGNKPFLSGLAGRVLDLSIRVRSFLRVAIGNANAFRTRANVYPLSRQRSMAAGLRHLSRALPRMRVELRIVKALIDAERIIIRVSKKILSDRTRDSYVHSGLQSPAPLTRQR